MTQEQAVKKVDETIICPICNEPIEPEDMMTYARPDGFDDFGTEPAHKVCVESLEEIMYRQGEFNG